MISAYTGMREGDVIRLPWSAWDDATITWRQRKTNKIVCVPAHPDLRAVIQVAPKRTTQIVCTRKGKAFTESGFRASFFKLLRKLASERKIGTGLTFHGLRTTIATRLADRGNDSRTIMAITGHTTESQVATYTEGADRRRRAVAGIASLERSRDGNGKP
jgi:integrase